MSRVCTVKRSFPSFPSPSDVQHWGLVRLHCNIWMAVTCWAWWRESRLKQNRQTVPDSLFREPVADVIEVGRVRTGWSPLTETYSSPQLSFSPLACQAIELSSSESTNGTPSWLETSSHCSELFSFQRALPKLFKSPLWRSEEQGRASTKNSEFVF